MKARRTILGVLAVLLLVAATGRARAQSGLDYFVIGRSGLSYFNVPGETRFGAAAGGDLAMALTADWGAVASLNGNFIPNGAQLVGTLGIVKLADMESGLIEDRLSRFAYFDQFTDTRVDTIAGSLYLHQARFQLGYAASEFLEVGLVYTEPTREDNDVNFLFTAFPGSLPAAGRVDMSRGGGVYAAGSLLQTQWSALLGYRDVPDRISLAAGLRRPLGDSLALFAGGSYETESGNWGLILGAEFALRPPFGFSRRDVEYTEPVTSPGAAAEMAETDEANEAETPSNMRLASLPGDLLETPPLNSGIFSQGLGAGDDVDESGAPSGELWTTRYYNWNARQVTVLHAHEAWRGLRGLGLTNRNQQRIQSPFTAFSLRTNGLFGRRDGDPND